MTRESLFLDLASRLRHLPVVRGKVRVLLSLYRALGLQNRHIVVEALLWRPTQYRVRLDLHSWLQRIAFLSGGYEEDTVRFLARLLPAGSCLLDIGANVGLISIPFVGLSAAKRTASPEPDLAVVAVEAVRANYEALVHNAELNGHSRTIRAFCAGVGEVEKSAEIRIEGDLTDGEGTGTANIMPMGSTHECQRNPLQITTIDKLLGDDLIAKCGLVKIDTDGYDLFALMGATRLLTETRPIVFGEFSAHCLAWHHQDVRQVAVFAAAMGYSVLARRPRAWGFVPLDHTQAFSQDLLLVPTERMSALAELVAEPRVDP